MAAAYLAAYFSHSTSLGLTEANAWFFVVQEFNARLLQCCHYPDKRIGAGIDMPVRFFHLPQCPERNLAALGEVPLGPAEKSARRP